VDGVGVLQAELEQKVQRERALAEAEGRAREARENEDINRRALTLRLEEERKKLVEAINTTFGSVAATPPMSPPQPLSRRSHV
jgi:ATPase family AAA domain-containing protein 3A/B